MTKILVKSEQFARARIKQGLTMAMLADKIKVSRQAIRQIERKICNPSPATAKAISNALCVQFEEIFDIGEGE